MEAERKKVVRPHLKNESLVRSIPPGFASRTSFNLVKVENSEQTLGSMACMDVLTQEPGSTDVAKLLKCKPWLLHGRSNQIAEVSNPAQPAELKLPSMSSVQRGVTHGCLDTSCSLKAAAGCSQEEKIGVLEEVPIFNPTEEEFSDTLKYIESIRLRAEPYGICRIIPPTSWHPPCLLKEKNTWENSVFVSQIQKFHRLPCQHIQGETTAFFNTSGCLSGSLTRRVLELGVSNSSRKSEEVGHSNVERLEMKTGPEFTLDKFKNLADDFKDIHFSEKYKFINGEVKSQQLELSVNEMEGEYRGIIEDPTKEIEVLRGDNLDTGVFGSGFPTVSNLVETSGYAEYLNSGWNLNILPRLSGSLLSFENKETSDLLVPRLHIGMCFSSNFWKVEEHHLYALYYMHLGAPKVWYGVPGRYSLRFEAVTKRHLSDLLAEQPNLCQRVITRLSPFVLKSDGVPVKRCIQYPGEFVLVFPGAYHSGFNCGFNCIESVNVALMDWLPHGLTMVEFYQEQRRKTMISHDKLLISAVKEALKEQWQIVLKKITLDNLRWRNACGKDGILTKALKSKVSWESNRRDYLCPLSQSQKMDENFDATCKRECSTCFYDLHLSAVYCPCSADRYSCLNHSKQLCSCGWTKKVFLYRYDINELNDLIKALEGNMIQQYKFYKENCHLKGSTSNGNCQASISSSRADIEATLVESKSDDNTEGRLTLEVESLKKEETKENLVSPLQLDSSSSHYEDNISLSQLLERVCSNSECSESMHLNTRASKKQKIVHPPPSN